MGKQKLWVSMGDKEFENRLVKGLLNHYGDQYEVHIFAVLEDYLNQNEKSKGLLLAAGFETQGKELLLGSNEKVLYFLEDGEEFISQRENLVCTSRYQELYLIEATIKKVIGEELKRNSNTRRAASTERRIGVFSTDCSSFQIPFCALLAAEYGEETWNILLDLQSYSGLDLENSSGILGLEDFMAMAATENFSESRMRESIVSEEKGDYIRPMRNPECFVEGTKDIYEAIIDRLHQQLGYEIIIMNFGDVFSGIYDLMETCEDFYFLVPKGESSTWREECFKQHLKLKGKEELYQKIRRIEIPLTYPKGLRDWKALVKMWRWSNVGDSLRKHMWGG